MPRISIAWSVLLCVAPVLAAPAAWERLRNEDGNGPTSGPAEPIDNDGFIKALAGLDRNDAGALVALGERAAAGRLEAQARRAWRAALRADPEHPRARALLGYVRFAGQWTTPEAVQRERGLIYKGGRWLSPAEARDTSPEAVVVPKPVEEAPKPTPAEVKPSDPDAWYDDHATIADWSAAAEFKSKRYLIRSNIKSEYLKRYGEMMDRYFERFLTVFKPVIVPGTTYTRSVIVIYPDQKSFLTTEKLPDGVGGFYRPKDRFVVGYHGRFGKTGTTRTVLAHEGTHQFQHLVLADGFSNCPIWLIEGLAVLFESAEWNDKLGKIDLGRIPRDRMETMKNAVSEKKTLPLATLFQTPQQAFGGFHYAHAWSVIYMSIYGTNSKKARDQNAKIISQLLTMGRQRRVRYNDVLTMFGGAEGLAKFEEEWKEWIEKTPYDFKPS